MTLRLTLTALLLCLPTAFAQAPDPCATAPQSCATLIETHATSEKRIPNTAVDVVVGITATGKDLAEVQRNLAGKTNTLTAYLQGQQVQRLVTMRVSFTPETRYDKSAADKTVGYNGTAKLSFRTTPAKVGDILAGVLSNGANQIESTLFTPTEQEIADARRELSADATRTATAQADAIAKAAGMKVVAIRNINVDNSSDFALQETLGTLAGFSGGRGVDKRMTSPINTASGDDQLSVQVNLVAAASR